MKWRRRLRERSQFTRAFPLAESSARDAYYQATLASNADAINASSESENASLDAELALCRSVLDADYALEVADIRADADFERRKLVFTRSYGDYLLATKWNDGDPRYAFNYEMLRVTDTFPYYAGVSEDLLARTEAF